MSNLKNRAKELNVAYIGGGSRGWAWGFMMDLAMDGDLCGTVRLYDIDRSAAQRKDHTAGGICLRRNHQRKRPLCLPGMEPGLAGNHARGEPDRVGGLGAEAVRNSFPERERRIPGNERTLRDGNPGSGTSG